MGKPRGPLRNGQILIRLHRCHGRVQEAMPILRESGGGTFGDVSILCSRTPFAVGVPILHGPDIRRLDRVQHVHSPTRHPMSSLWSPGGSGFGCLRPLQGRGALPVSNMRRGGELGCQEMRSVRNQAQGVLEVERTLRNPTHSLQSLNSVRFSRWVEGKRCRFWTTQRMWTT